MYRKPFTKPFSKFNKLVGFLLIGSVKLYQYCISPFLPHVCRFYPSCSHYMIDAISVKGPRGVWLGIKRLACCHPFHPGGLDPVKETV